MAQYVPLPGYVTALSNKKVWKGDGFGPSNYQAGGVVLYPASFGMGGLESISPSAGAYSFSQNYTVRVFYPANAATATENQAASWGTGNNANTAPVMKWYTAANGVEVANNTNLAAEAVRLEVWGV